MNPPTSRDDKYVRFINTGEGDVVPFRSGRYAFLPIVVKTFASLHTLINEFGYNSIQLPPHPDLMEILPFHVLYAPTVLVAQAATYKNGEIDKEYQFFLNRERGTFCITHDLSEGEGHAGWDYTPRVAFNTLFDILEKNEVDPDSVESNPLGNILQHCNDALSWFNGRQLHFEGAGVLIAQQYERYMRSSRELHTARY